MSASGNLSCEQLSRLCLLRVHSQPTNSALEYYGMRNASIAILGIMVTRSGRWVIHSWLRRHATMFEKLSVLDGSPVGSIDAVWTEQQVALYPNCVYGNEAHANLRGPPTDQTARAAALRLLLLDEEHLRGRWILNAHPDEYYLQDVRALILHVSLRDPHATCILFGAAYVLPTVREYEAIIQRYGSANGHVAFEAIGPHLNSVDAGYLFKEPRLWKYVQGTRWGTRHSITTPETHPGHRKWPTVREERVEPMRMPFFVHFKIHDFGPNAFTVAPGCGGGMRCGKRQSRATSSWIAFNGSGFGTGLAPHRTHGSLTVDGRRSAREQVLAYYDLAGRPPVRLDADLKRRCHRVVPKCSVPWTAKGRFRRDPP